MNSFAVVLFFATAAAPHAGQHPVFPRRHLGGTYSQVAKLTAADAAANDEFGRSVAIDGGTVVVGARNENNQRGAAYVFRTSDGGATYGQVAKLTAADGAASDWFGYSVAIDGNTIVAGAYAKDRYTGAVYVFRTTDGGATYAEVAKLTAADAAGNDLFGTSVAIAGGTVVSGSFIGAAFVFSPLPTPAPSTAALESDSATRAGTLATVLGVVAATALAL